MSKTDLGEPCWFLVPERQDSRPGIGNGQAQSGETLLRLFKEVRRVADGATKGVARTTVFGAWEGIEDWSVRYEVALTGPQQEELTEVLERFVRPLGQECLYVVLGGRRAYLVFPPDPEPPGRTGG